jgi:hypothetical protein
MEKNQFLVTALIITAILTSGCAQTSNQSKLKLSTTEMKIEGNQTQELGFRIKNNQNQTQTFSAALKPEKTRKKYFKIIRDNKEQRNFNLGDAAANRHTSWKYAKLQGIPENIDGSAIAIKLHINAHKEGTNKTIDNQTIPVTITK